jgi:hypothetical protein
LGGQGPLAFGRPGAVSTPPHIEDFRPRVLQTRPKGPLGRLLNQLRARLRAPRTPSGPRTPNSKKRDRPPEGAGSLEFNRGKRFQTDPGGGGPPGVLPVSLRARPQLSSVVLLDPDTPKNPVYRGSCIPGDIGMWPGPGPGYTGTRIHSGSKIIAVVVHPPR